MKAVRSLASCGDSRRGSSSSFTGQRPYAPVLFVVLFLHDVNIVLRNTTLDGSLLATSKTGLPTTITLGVSLECGVQAHWHITRVCKLRYFASQCEF